MDTFAIEPNPAYWVMANVWYHVGSILDDPTFHFWPVFPKKIDYSQIISKIRNQDSGQVREFIEAFESGKKFLIVNTEPNILKKGCRPDVRTNRIVNLAWTVTDSDFRPISKTNLYIIPDGQNLSPIFDDNWGLNETALKREGVTFRDAYAKLLEVFDPDTMVVTSWDAVDMFHLMAEADHFGMPKVYAWKDQHQPFVLSSILLAVISGDSRSFYDIRRTINVSTDDFIEDAGTRSQEISMMLRDVFRPFNEID